MTSTVRGFCGLWKSWRAGGGTRVRFAAVTAGRRQPSNSRSRTPCRRSGSHRVAPPPAAYRGTADIAGDRGGGRRRRPFNPRQTSSRPGRTTAPPRLDGSLPTHTGCSARVHSSLWPLTRLPGVLHQADRGARYPAELAATIDRRWRLGAVCPDTCAPLPGRSASTSRLGGAPNSLAYSRLNCDGIS